MSGGVGGYVFQSNEDNYNLSDINANVPQSNLPF